MLTYFYQLAFDTSRFLDPHICFSCKNGYSCKSVNETNTSGFGKKNQDRIHSKYTLHRYCMISHSRRTQLFSQQKQESLKCQAEVAISLFSENNAERLVLLGKERRRRKKKKRKNLFTMLSFSVISQPRARAREKYYGYVLSLRKRNVFYSSQLILQAVSSLARVTSRLKKRKKKKKRRRAKKTSAENAADAGISNLEYSGILAPNLVLRETLCRWSLRIFVWNGDWTFYPIWGCLWTGCMSCCIGGRNYNENILEQVDLICDYLSCCWSRRKFVLCEFDYLLFRL